MICFIYGSSGAGKSCIINSLKHYFPATEIIDGNWHMENDTIVKRQKLIAAFIDKSITEKKILFIV